jgi:hypothetical protein
MFAGPKRPRQERIIETEVNIINRIHQSVCNHHNITKNTAPRGIASRIQSPLIASFLSSQSITPPISAQTSKSLIVDMLIECRLAFLLTEKPSFQRLLNYAQSTSSIEQVQAPNADTVRA